MNERTLPIAPPLQRPSLPPTGEPTAQERRTDRDGGPLEALSTCRWCGGMHPTACPYIKVAEWHPSGQLSRVVLEERAAQKAAILYPFEDEDDSLRRTLTAIAEAADLEHAQGLARALIAVLDDAEKPSA